MLAFAGSAILLTLASLWLESQIAKPLELLKQQALTIATGNKQHVKPLQGTDEISITYGAINQQGLMFRWLANDVSTQLHNPVKDEQKLPHSVARLSRCDPSRWIHWPPSGHAFQENFSPDQDRDIQQILDKIATTLEQISLSTKQIDDISLLIDNIAFQANILA